MKTIKILVVLAFLGLSGFVGKSRADGYYTTRSTAICITSGTNIEITAIALSTGSMVPFQAYALIVDSNPLTFSTAGITNGIAGVLPAESGDWTQAKYPVEQQLFPPLVFPTSGTVNMASPLVYQSLVDAQGHGRPVEKGITVFILGGGGTTNTPQITIWYKKKDQHGY